MCFREEWADECITTLKAHVCSVKSKRLYFQEQGMAQAEIRGLLAKNLAYSWLSVTEQKFQSWEIPKLYSSYLERISIYILYLNNIYEPCSIKCISLTIHSCPWTQATSEYLWVSFLDVREKPWCFMLAYNSVCLHTPCRYSFLLCVWALLPWQNTQFCAPSHFLFPSKAHKWGGKINK